MTQGLFPNAGGRLGSLGGLVFLLSLGFIGFRGRSSDCHGGGIDIQDT